MIDSFTQSNINMFFKCGVQFQMRYLDNIIIPPAIVARKGSSVHAGAEYNFRRVIEKQEQAPIDEVCDVARDTFVRLIKDEGIWLPEAVENQNQLVADTLDETIQTTKFYHKHIAPSHKKIAIIEERLYADVNIGIPVSGKPDVITDGIINDIKTASKRWGKGEENTQFQPTIYKLITRQNGLGDLPFQYEILTNHKNAPKDLNGCIWDSETNTCGDIRTVERTPEDEELLIKRIKLMKQAITEGNFLPAPPNSWYCSKSWCGYYSICPYQKRSK